MLRIIFECNNILQCFLMVFKVDGFFYSIITNILYQVVVVHLIFYNQNMKSLDNKKVPYKLSFNKRQIIHTNNYVITNFTFYSYLIINVISLNSSDYNFHNSDASNIYICVVE